MTEVIQKSKTDDEILSEYDNKLRNTLQRIYNNLSGNNIDLVDIKNTLDMLKKYNKAAYREYLDTLLHPETFKGIKIPSYIPVPSCVFQWHNSITLTTDNDGNIRWLFNPNFLYNKNMTNFGIFNSGNIDNHNYEIESVKYLSTFYISTDDTFSPFHHKDIGQGIPGVYKSFRVVSASVIMRYIGSLKESCGYIGGAIVYDDGSYGGVITAHDYNYDISCYTDQLYMNKYMNTDIANDAFYNQEGSIHDTIRMIYFPIDNSYSEYNNVLNKISDVKHKDVSSGFVLEIQDKITMKNKDFIFYGYVNGAPIQSPCIKLDFYVNYECLPDSLFLNYMPVSTDITQTNEMDLCGVVKEVRDSSISVIKEDEENMQVDTPEVSNDINNS